MANHEPSMSDLHFGEAIDNLADACECITDIIAEIGVAISKPLWNREMCRKRFERLYQLIVSAKSSLHAAGEQGDLERRWCP